IVGIWVGNDDRSPMRGVIGGSLPAVMWKEFMSKAASRLPAAERARVTEDNSASAIPDAPWRARCDLRACAKRYQSFDAEDCTFQPYGGGPRRACEIAATSGQQLEVAAHQTDDADVTPRSATAQPKLQDPASGPIVPIGPPTKNANAPRPGAIRAAR